MKLDLLKQLIFIVTKKNLNYVIYKFPNDLEPTIIINQQIMKFNNLNEINNKVGFIISSFNLDKIYFFAKNNSLIFKLNNLNQSDISQIEKFKINSKQNLTLNITEENQTQYLTKIELIKTKILTKKLKKIVYSRVKIIESIKNPVNIFLDCLKQYPKNFNFYFNLSNGYKWLGSSPELLLKQTKHKIKFFSLAGTQNKLSWNSKEKLEQNLVTQFIINKLKKFCSNINVKAQETIKMGEIFHLKNEIIADLLPSTKLIHLIKIIHPTPAIAGIPQQLAIEKILQLEQHNRLFYTGFLGLLDSSNQTNNLYINLRSMQILNNQFILYAGGGILKQSNSQQEWQETENKFNNLLNIIK